MAVATVRDALAEAVRRLRVRDADGARFDAALLLAHVLGRDAAWLLAHDDAPLDGDAAARFDAAVARRAAGEPVPYITGFAGFYGRRFAVDRRVLVPRPETEAAVEAALDAVRGGAPRGVRFCDVGTGSGAIAVTLACEAPDAHVTAVDVSADALDVARRNAIAHGVDGRIRFVHGDGLRAAADAAPFTCIVANLPYVRTADLAAAPDPTSFEPRLALDGGADGLELYRALLRDAASRLGPGGALVMEAGPDTVPALAAAARAAFPGGRVATHRDYAERDRLVVVDASNDVRPASELA